MGKFMLYLLCIVLMFMGSITIATSPHKTLVEQLTEDYPPKYTRPVKNHTDVMEVSFYFYPFLLVELNPVEQSVTIAIWAQMQWLDEYLTWDHTEHDDITYLRLEPGKYWEPGLFFKNRAQNYKDPDQYEHPLYVDSDGLVIKDILSVTKFLCNLNMVEYPQDYHSCNGEVLTIYSSSEMSISAETFVANISQFSNSEYEIDNFTVSVDERNDMKLEFSISRSSSFLSYTIVKPVMMLYFVTTLSFLLPPSSEAKIDILMNVLIAFSVLMMILSAQLPVAKDIPKILKSMMDAMILNVVSLAVAIITMRISYIEGIKPTPMAEKIMSYLGRAILLPYPLSSSLKISPEDSGDPVIRSEHENTDTKLIHALGVLADWVDSMEKDAKLKNFWNHVACILDRMFFLILLSISIKFAVEHQ